MKNEKMEAILKKWKEDKEVRVLVWHITNLLHIILDYNTPSYRGYGVYDCYGDCIGFVYVDEDDVREAIDQTFDAFCHLMVGLK